MNPKEKFNNYLQSIVRFEVPDNHLEKYLLNSNGLYSLSSLFWQMKSGEAKSLLFQACLWIYRKKQCSLLPLAVKGLVECLHTDKNKTLSLSQEDIKYVAGLQPDITPYAMRSTKELQDLLKLQLKLVNLMELAEDKKSLALQIYRSMLDINHDASTQQAIVKHWKNIGPFHEIEPLVPAFSPATSKISKRRAEVCFMTIDCDKIGIDLEKISQRNVVMMHVEEILGVFLAKQSEHGMLYRSKIDNKIELCFAHDGKHDELEYFLNMMSTNIHSLVVQAPIKTRDEAAEMFDKVMLNMRLQELPVSMTNKIRSKL